MQLWVEDVNVALRWRNYSDNDSHKYGVPLNAWCCGPRWGAYVLLVNRPVYQRVTFGEWLYKHLNKNAVITPVLFQKYIIKTAAEEHFYNFGERGKEIRPQDLFLGGYNFKIFVTVCQKYRSGWIGQAIQEAVGFIQYSHEGTQIPTGSSRFHFSGMLKRMNLCRRNFFFLCSVTYQK
jgi:hypothetical protein